MSPNNISYSNALVSTAMLTSNTSALSLMDSPITGHYQYSHQAPASTTVTELPADSNGNDANPSARSTSTPKRNTVRAGGVQKKTASSSVGAHSGVGDSPRKGRAATPSKQQQQNRRTGSTSAADARDTGDDSRSDEEDSGNEGGNNGDKTAEQQRRRRFLERNRVAASKCRQKKKMWIQELERRAEDVTMQNRSLHIAVAQLKEEVMILKNQLLAHRNCGCTSVQQFLQTDVTAPTDTAVAQAMSAAMVAPPGFPLATQPPHTLASPQQQQQIANSMATQAVLSQAAGAASSLLIQPSQPQSILLPQSQPHPHPHPHPHGFAPAKHPGQVNFGRHNHSPSVDMTSVHQANSALAAAAVLTTSPSSGSAPFVSTSISNDTSYSNISGAGQGM
ncbi:hypothetical protein GGI15_002039 [Coemansia interrupta]|uniref:BZIP domain-containing protein n=1 Tax=Coemansia interrupta TaxID=1126814 RepID=A0A9W8LMD9_9FUNG|nr:hypothetical protein GGI15_002039 [Coemansia interrupta]